MTTESFLINPPKRKRKRKAAAPRKRRVTKRSTRAKATKSRRRKGIGREGSKHRPVVVTRGGKWVTSRKGRLTRPGVRVNPFGEELMLMGANPRRKRIRRYRRNPAILRGLPRLGGVDLGNVIPLAITGGASVVATSVAPGMARVSSKYARYGVQAAVGIGGAVVLNRTLKGQHGTIWAVTSFAMIVSDVLQQHVLGRLGISMAGLGAEYPEYYESMGAFPYEGDEEVGAYPEEVAVEGLSDYPYEETIPY